MRREKKTASRGKHGVKEKEKERERERTLKLKERDSE